MKQTAVEWLESLYYPNYIPKEIFDQAKEMEKEQIENAFSDGVDDEYEYHINSEPRKNSEQYYKEKFKNKKNGNNNN
jgi:hypothetical protein